MPRRSTQEIRDPMKRHLAAALLILVAATGAQAVPKQWTAAVDHKWSTPGNWFPAGTPAAGDDLRFFSPADETVINDLPAGTVLADVDVTSYHTVTITGNPVIVSNYVGSGSTGMIIFNTDVTVLGSAWGIGGNFLFTNLHVAAGSTVQLGSYTTVSGSLTGSGTIFGTYGLTITGPSSYAGTLTMVSLLTIDGSCPGISAVLEKYSERGALRGTGTLGDATIYGRLDPGPNPCNGLYCPLTPFGSTPMAHTIGTLTVGALTLAAGAEATIDLSASGGDLVSASSVSLAGALAVYPTSALVTGTVSTIIDNRGASPINGTFAGLPEGARVDATPPSKGSFLVSYHGGNGNDVTLTARGHSTLTVSAPAQTAVGVTVPVTVHVGWDGARPNPAGSVTLSINGLPPQTLALDAGGNAPFNVTVIKGQNALTATYAGTVLYDGSTSSVEVFGGKRQPYIATVSRPDPAPLAEPFTLAVSLFDSSSPTGTMTVSEGSTLLASANVTDTITDIPMQSLSPGTHTLLVSYSGDSAHDPASVTVMQNVASFAAAITYAQPSGSSPLTLSLSIPAGNGPFPLILAIETDSWSIQPKSSTAVAREVTRGWAVATAHFRSTFPAQITDLKAALRWLRANAALYNLQPNRFVAWGIGPAGGQLAALLGTSANVAALDDPNEGNAALSSRVQGVIDWSGADDLTSFGTCAGTLGSAARALGAAALPAAYASTDDPPFLLMHGGFDCAVAPVAPISLASALRAVSVDTTLVMIDGAAASGNQWDSTAVMTIVDAFLDAKALPPTSRRRSVGRP